MFYHINGKVTDIEPNLAVIDCAGVGFALSVSVNTLSHLQIGENVKLYTYENVREDAFDLFGFFDKQEKRSFEMLLGVSGVGPKAAISILSAVTPEALAMAVISGDEKALTAAPGIGKKIAQRILLELKDKMAKETSGFDLRGNAVSTLPLGGSKLSDAVSALAVLGYSNSEITMAMKDIDVDNTELESIIKQALRKMLK
ncbi:MAG: Holliday junction branch migration protein RuvA [Oscillospiraceae bacterium]|nr:Holliday junction branch migration protein RuvA [Oscillospiraceae bacterium]